MGPKRTRISVMESEQSWPLRRWFPPVLGAVALGLYGHLGSLRGWGGRDDVLHFLTLMGLLFVLYGATLWAWWRPPKKGGGYRATGGIVLLGALMFRLALIPAGLPGGWSEVPNETQDEELAFRTFLLYDNDVWRYLWDGHVVASGVNTYLYSPADIEAAFDADEAPLAGLLEESIWQEVHERVSYANHRTIYPPLAQGAFVLSTAIAPASVATWKLLLTLFDLATCWLLFDILRRRSLNPGLLAIYAWNPLVIKEISGSGHLDGLMIFCLALCWWSLERRRQALALGALAAAILVKLTPLLLVPLVLRHVHVRRWWILPAAAVLGYGPLIGTIPTMVESLKAFSSEWVFNPGPWLLVREASQLLGFQGRAVADLVALAATLTVVTWVAWRFEPTWDGLIVGSQWILATYLLMSPTVMPWYLLWALPLWVLRPGITWPSLTALSLLSYLVYIDGVERGAWLAVEFVLFFALALWVAWRRRAFRTAPSLREP